MDRGHRWRRDHPARTPRGPTRGLGGRRDPARRHGARGVPAPRPPRRARQLLHVAGARDQGHRGPRRHRHPRADRARPQRRAARHPVRTGAGTLRHRQDRRPRPATGGHGGLHPGHRPHAHPRPRRARPGRAHAVPAHHPRRGRAQRRRPGPRPVEGLPRHLHRAAHHLRGELAAPPRPHRAGPPLPRAGRHRAGELHVRRQRGERHHRPRMGPLRRPARGHRQHLRCASSGTPRAGSPGCSTSTRPNRASPTPASPPSTTGCNRTCGA